MLDTDAELSQQIGIARIRSVNHDHGVSVVIGARYGGADATDISVDSLHGVVHGDLFGADHGFVNAGDAGDVTRGEVDSRRAVHHDTGGYRNTVVVDDAADFHELSRERTLQLTEV